MAGMHHEQEGGEMGERLADAGLMIGSIVVVVAAVAFSLAPIWI